MKYAIYFGDGTFDSTMAISYQHFTDHLPFIVHTFLYTDKQGCISGVNGPATIKVIGADPFFGVDTKKFCDSGTVYFTNYTIGNDPVVTRTWDFGDGSPTTSVTDPLAYVHATRSVFSFPVSNYPTGLFKTIYDTIRVYRTPDPYIVGDSIGCLNDNTQPAGICLLCPIQRLPGSGRWEVPTRRHQIFR